MVSNQPADATATVNLAFKPPVPVPNELADLISIDNLADAQEKMLHAALNAVTVADDVYEAEQDYLIKKALYDRRYAAYMAASDSTTDAQKRNYAELMTFDEKHDMITAGAFHRYLRDKAKAYDLVATALMSVNNNQRTLTRAAT